MKAFVVVALLVNWASAQSYSGHSGWSFEDTRQKATDVVVADAMAGTVTDTGSEVTVKATLKVVRTLKGSPAPGAEVAVEWQYHPIGMQREAPLPKDPPLRGIWFWRKGADGKVEILQATGWSMSLGGYYLPAGAAPRYYRADAPLGQKIASELAPLMEEVAAQHAGELARPPSATGPMPAARMQFGSLAMALEALGKDATAEVYAHFSSLPDPNLKLVGISGRLRSGDVGSLAELEKNLPSLDTVLRSRVLPELFPMGVDLRNDVPSAHRLGRLAIAETPLGLIESQAPYLLAQTRSPEMLPYLGVLLESPNPSARGSAMMAFCQLLGPYGPPSPVSDLWQPGMRDYCPNGSPVNDREVEARDIRYWKEWWAAHRESIGKTVALPQVFPPARYRTTPVTEMREVPMEIRFQSLVGMSARRTEHYHDASGAIVEGPMPGPPNPLLSRMPEGDREAYQLILAATQKQLEECDHKAQTMMDQARMGGTRPSREAFEALSKERNDALKAGMAQMQSRLSAEGWRVVESFLKGMGIVAASPVGK